MVLVINITTYFLKYISKYELQCVSCLLPSSSPLQSLLFSPLLSSSHGIYPNIINQLNLIIS